MRNSTKSNILIVKLIEMTQNVKYFLKEFSDCMRVWINDYTTYSRHQIDCVLVTLTEENQRKTTIKCNERLNESDKSMMKNEKKTMEHIFLFSFMGFVRTLRTNIEKKKIHVSSHSNQIVAFFRILNIW